MLCLSPKSKYFILCSLTLFILGLGACRPLTPGKLSDIYRIDQSNQTAGNQRRHAASNEEIVWTVSSKGCSAILLSPQYMLTADHCVNSIGDRLRTGWSIMTNGGDDLEIVAIRERSVELDYKIVQVRWLTSIPRQMKYPPRIAMSAEDVYSSPNPEQGDELFTVGFPDDRDGVWRATYAEGQAKIVDAHQLYFNVGIINGSSGGGVLKKENFMLVSLANGGRKNLGELGWNTADADEFQAWNYGTALWQIYERSSLLKLLFPSGVNAELKGSFQPKTQIYLSVSGEGSAASLWVATSLQAEDLVICPGFVKDCRAGLTGGETLKSSKSLQGRAFFPSKQSPEKLKAMTLSAFDKSGILIGQRQVLLERGE